MDYESLSENKLVKQSQQGKVKAFEELLFRNKEKLFSWVVSFSKNPHASEEIYQITTIKCWQNITKFKGNSKFLTWACSIARNLSYDIWRKNQRHQIYSFEELLEKESEDGIHFQMKIDRDAEDNIAAKMDSHQNLNKIYKKLDGLSPEHKEALLLSVEDGLEYKEIAERQNCPIGTVMSRIFYARKIARRNLKSTYEEIRK